MEPYQPCSDASDLCELSHHHQLYLKSEAKISITVALPNVRLPGKTVSNWEVMERLRQSAQPYDFQVMKVNKTTLEFIRFDAEIENRAHIRTVISKLDGKVIRLSGFPEPLKIRAAEAKPEFPSRHDWDRYFRDAKNMNEMKSGERPDTVHIQGLPSKWFASPKDRRSSNVFPSETVLQQVFGVFGEVRCVDIPMLDPYRNMMKASISGIRTFSHANDTTFDAYIQYREYICFVKAMDSLRGMKLVFKEGDKAYSSSIKVDFDKTKHLSDMSIRRRAVEREKLMAKEREAEEQKRKEEDAVKRTIEEEERKKMEEKRLKGERRKEREEKRKQKILKKLKKKEAEQMNIKIAIEERKLLMAQRKLESIRLLDELFERVKIAWQKEVGKDKGHDNQLTKKRNDDKLKKKEDKEVRKKEKMIAREKQLRKKLVSKIKSAQEQQMEERREKLRRTIEGKGTIRVKPKDGEVDGDLENMERIDYHGYDYNTNFDPYAGYGFGGEWGQRGFRGRYFPRRPYRGIRPYRSIRGGYQAEWWPPNKSDWMPSEAKKEKKTGADDIEDVSSDSVSSGSSKYSKLDSSSAELGKDTEKKGEWPGYDVNPASEGLHPSHPWAGYSDYYNPRFMRRASRRPGGSFRGWPSRGSYGVTPNPNVPMNSFYMQSINNQYYRYFNRLAKGDPKSSRSRSNSSERVVCRKVLSRSRSRGKSSHSRSRSRSRSRSHSRSRSRPKSRKRSKSSSRSKSKSWSSSRDRKSKSKSVNKQKDEVEEHPEEEIGRKERTEEGLNRHKDIRDDKEGSDFSLSLSGSEEWSKGSPERKARPLGDPNWEPNERRFRRRNFEIYDRSFPPFRFEVRSHVTRPDIHHTSSKSRIHISRRHESRRSRERDEPEKSSRRSRSKDSSHIRSRDRDDVGKHSHRSRSGESSHVRSRDRDDLEKGSRRSRSKDTSQVRSRDRNDIDKRLRRSKSRDSSHLKSRSRDDSGKRSRRSKSRDSYHQRSRDKDDIEKRSRRSRSNDSPRHRYRDREDLEKRSHRSKSRNSTRHRSPSGHSRSDKSRDESPKARSEKSMKRDRHRQKPSTSKKEAGDHSSSSKSKHKKEKKRKVK